MNASVIAATYRRDEFRLRATHAALAAPLLVAAVVLALFGFADRSEAAFDKRILNIARAAAGGLSDNDLEAVTGKMDPAMLSLARRYDPAFRASTATALTLSTPPSGFGRNELTVREAVDFNAALPFSTDANPAARPFSDKIAANDRELATQCMTQAVYYEAAFEPLDGQRAVAQVILNRTRHPAFPKSVCGVVYQGSNRITGCQFSFTCDGSLARRPAAWAWDRARKVAEAAMAGYVMKAVGGATHYHADYVFPYWAPGLAKVNQIGAHIFYRWPGGWGLPQAFNGKYAGAERPGFDVDGDRPTDLGLAAAQQATEATRLVASLAADTSTAQAHAEPLIVEEERRPEAINLPPELATPAAPVRPARPPRLALPG
jgi:spore germination cell wall hydrolase CwlJ-like protein